jgi:hypothetical protein
MLRLVECMSLFVLASLRNKYIYFSGTAAPAE